LLGLFDPEEGDDKFARKSVDFNGLHGIISKKTELFIPTAVRTSGPTSSPQGR
jgi:hypothetical protein